MIDIHTHILPGVDDGSRDWDMTLEMLKESFEAGVKKVIATPHYLPWKKNTKPEMIKQLCSEAQKKLLNKYGIVMDIYPGNEIYYNLSVIQKLKDGEVLTLAGSRYVLVEFTKEASCQMCFRAVRELEDNGYIPIIAHAERYAFLRSFQTLQELKQMDALIQMNIESCQGFFLGGHWSKRCLLNKVVDFLCSDMHDLNRRIPFTEKQLHWIQKRIEPGYQTKLLCSNAQKVLDDIRI